ncbi:MAG: hypothetical protein GTO45_41840 [Candidatus Aminicenantes bacterium]|nr:hypothetical protein [Candidatus Aminicenantes bacterium]NIM85154.1 hypothetical protein [Candidatus Aminicenantes bacterium]NIN24664.1 hypothetical protein [Candidatus Aminicenantes bacterium]NIN48425.1 hypothetical protein [Candidatus Aminicenantes bacterium]NIN91328.1 hypothetical protein [Candidatus Aminicenantes bacterium]
MRKKELLVFILLVLVNFSAAYGNGKGLSVIEAIRANEPIRVDGLLK